MGAGLRKAWLLCVAGVLGACSGERSVSATLSDGAVVGVRVGRTQIFRGIPFAKPPTGARRFAAPVAAEPWSTARDATEFGATCPQLEVGKETVSKESAEDCLFVNVWAPTTPGPHPVMVFVPGGAYIFGAGSQPLYEGQRLSEAGDVVVVTMNYRMSAFGFLAHPALRRESQRSAGDYALLDQRLAFQWVKRNIAALGGDPGNITAFGESAGAGSLCMHLVSPGSAGLFDRAILESTPCTGFPFPTQDQAESQALEVTKKLGCEGGTDASVLECLRNASVEDVLHALPLNDHIIYGKGVGWGPIVDGTTVPAPPLTLLTQTPSASVPLIVGSNADEGTIFFANGVPLSSEADVREALSELFRPSDVDAILAHYGLEPTPHEAGIRMVSDIFTCDARRIARLHTAAGGTAYGYYFTRPFYDAVIGLGAFHSSEMPFVFGNAYSGLPVLPAGIPLKNAMQAYWTAFARTGTPHPEGYSAWPKYAVAEDTVLRLDLQVSQTSRVQSDACDFWDRLRAAAP